MCPAGSRPQGLEFVALHSATHVHSYSSPPNLPWHQGNLSRHSQIAGFRYSNDKILLQIKNTIDSKYINAYKRSQQFYLS
jgi:hypothetical protein